MKDAAYIQKIVGREILDSRGNPTVEVDSSCCAGVAMESHQTALDAMKAVQIEIL